VDDNWRAKYSLSLAVDSRFAVTPDRGLPAARPVTAEAARGLFKIAGGPLDGHRLSVLKVRSRRRRPTPCDRSSDGARGENEEAPLSL
jgi:hypothetical protein